MKLLLDEQYSTDIPAQLRAGGYDVVSVHDLGLAGIADRPLLEAAVGAERALMTNNVRDFAPLAAAWAAEGRDHNGLVFASDPSSPRARNTIGMFVNALEELLDAEPSAGGLKNQVRWLVTGL